ncbi:MAG: hypothetical protein HGA45_36725 [Chloroflexales bacterium]|nr:hypothetical protein [Chloroflexales bacterium]
MCYLSLAILCLLLSGCMLMSGEATTVDMQEGSGNLLTTFVGAEGSSQRELDIGAPGATVQVIAIIGVESGDLELSLLGPDGAAAFTVAARPDAQVTRSGSVRADDAGKLRYSVSARGARNGTYQLFVQP